MKPWRSRFKSGKGDRALENGWDVARALGTTIVRRLFDKRTEVPWLTYSATREIERHFQKVKEPVVFEYGAGMSTVWFSRRAKELVSVENNPAWVDIVHRIVPDVPITLRQGPDYPAYIDRYPDQFFDLILLDGLVRHECYDHAFEKLKVGGLLVIDNTDVDLQPGGEMLQVEQRLQRDKDRLSIRRYPGWMPNFFYVIETTICERLR